MLFKTTARIAKGNSSTWGDRDMKIKMTVGVVVVVAVLLVGLVGIAPPANANHTNHIESRDLGDIKRDSDVLRRENGQWYEGEGGGTGSNGFWYTYNSDSYARWYFTTLRGTYRVEHFYPGRDAVKKYSCGMFNTTCVYRPPTASPRFKIWQFDWDRDRWDIIFDRVSSVKDQNGEYKTGWWGWSDNIELDGYIVVEVRKSEDENNLRLAADSFRLLWRGFLPEDSGTPPDEPPPTTTTTRTTNTTGDTKPPELDEYKVWLPDREIPAKGRVMDPCDLDTTDWPPDGNRLRANRSWTYDKKDWGTAEHGNATTLYHFFAGECTSWIMFRLQHEGIGFYNGYRWNEAGVWGNADNWDEAARQIDLLTDTPRPGVVAQWNHRGGGHAAYVEEVKDGGNTIIVSELNYRPDEVCFFSRRTIKRNDTGPDVVDGWPHNFIDFSK